MTEVAYIEDDGTAVELPPPLSIRRADLARVKPTRWIWERRIPSGYLSLILGAEGAGKGTLWPWIVARATKGRLEGSFEGTPVSVLVLGDEDGFDSVIVPRCHAAGADLDRLAVLDDDGAFDIRQDASRLGELIARGGYKLVIIDALLDVLGLDVDDWRSKQVRGALRPIRLIARELDVAILASLHPNKGQRGSFRDLLSGSHAFNALSRSSLLLAPHPDDEDRRVLVRGKGNLSAPPPSFEFAIEGRALEINGHDFSVPVLVGEAEGDLGVSDVIKPQREAPVRDKLAEEIDRLGTGDVQTRADIARALNRKPDDRSVSRALEELESKGHWRKVGRGKWQCVRIGIGTYRDVPMSNGSGVNGSGGVA